MPYDRWAWCVITMMNDHKIEKWGYARFSPWPLPGIPNHHRSALVDGSPTLILAAPNSRQDVEELSPWSRNIFNQIRVYVMV